MDLLDCIWQKKAPADEDTGAYTFGDKVSDNVRDEQGFEVEYFGTASEAVSLEIEPFYFIVR